MVYIIRSFLKNKQNTTKQTDRNDGEEESACWPGERSGGMSYKDMTVGRTRGLDPADELPAICSSLSSDRLLCGRNTEGSMNNDHPPTEGSS